MGYTPRCSEFTPSSVFRVPLLVVLREPAVVLGIKSVIATCKARQVNLIPVLYLSSKTLFKWEILLLQLTRKKQRFMFTSHREFRADGKVALSRLQLIPFQSLVPCMTP